MNDITLTLKRIDPIKVAVISAVVYTIIALVIMVPILIIAHIFYGSVAPFQSLGIIEIVIIVPVFYGVMGFIFALFGMVLFNWMLRFTKGLAIDVEAFDIQIQKYNQP